jgi:C4-dicarboxylate transporter DctQ subunit
MMTVNRFVENIEKHVCICTFAVMLALTFVNVLSRFFLHISLSFSEEIVTGLFVLASLAGSSVAVREGSHLGLDYLVSFTPQTVRKALALLGNLLGIVMCGVIFYYGLFMVADEYASGQLSATMQWPEWIYGSTVPLGASLLIFRYCHAIYLLICHKPGGLATGPENTR